MKCRKNLWFQGAALLLIAITVLLAPGAGAQSKYKILHRFKGTKGRMFVVTGLTFDQEGNLYGATQLGYVFDTGTVFKLTPNANGSWTESVLYKFCPQNNCADGAQSSSLIFDQAGNLYGTANQGGLDALGTVFKLTPNADGNWTESVLHKFTGGTDGANPSASLIFDQAGNLYATTSRGGDHDLGTVFKLRPNADGGWTESVLHSFTGGTDGNYPAASLIFDQGGNLYGTTIFCGDSSSCPYDNCGVVFELMPNANGTWTESVLYRFGGGKHGQSPSGHVIFDQAGNLYGTAAYGGHCGDPGCGVVFELTRQTDGSWAESVLYSFSGDRDGREPLGGLIFDAAGNLYGTTVEGGAQNLGTVFKLTPNADGKWTETVPHRFLDRPGASPYAGLIFDASGNLYGTTSSTFGSVFEITP